MKQRLFSVLLVFALLLSLLPAAAFAVEEPAQNGGVYQISTAEELVWFRNQVNAGNYALHGVLTADLDLNNQNWTPIGLAYATAYTGSFDGQHHTISGLSVSSASAIQGLFGFINGAIIQNLIVSNASVIGTNNIGGIVGQSHDSIIERCSFSGSVTATSSSGRVGGILGGTHNTSAATAINSCANTGTISGATAGGILGYGAAVISDCYNTGDVSGTTRASGIAGQLQSGSATGCYNIGDLSGNASPADICGFFTASAAIDACFYRGERPQGNDANHEKVTNCISFTTLEDLLENFPDSAIWTPDIENINGGYPIFAWQAGSITPPDLTPSVSISGGTIYANSGGGASQIPLTLTLANIADAHIERIEWSIAKQGGGEAITIASLAAVEGTDRSVIALAAIGGVATVTVTVIAGGETYTDTAVVMVIPDVTTVSVINPATDGNIAIGQTVTAKVNLRGGGEYDYDLFPILTYQWRNGTSNIVGATGKSYTISADDFAEWNNISVQALYSSQEVGNPTNHAVRSGDHGLLYPVAYDAGFTIPTVIQADGPLHLPVTHTLGGVTANINWQFTPNEFISPEQDITLPTEGKQTIALTARFEYGSAFANKNFTLTLWSPAAMEEAQAVTNSYLEDAAASLGAWYRLTPVYGTDENITAMVAADLAARGYDDVVVTLTAADQISDGCTIAKNGDITYFYANPAGMRGLWFGRYDLTFTLSKDDAVHSLAVPATIYWNQDMVKDTMRIQVLDALTEAVILGSNDASTNVTDSLVLPKIVGGQKWALINWSSDNTGAISVSTENQTTADTLFDPFVGSVVRGTADKTVTLTATVTFQRSNDLIGLEPPIVLYKTFTVTVKALDDAAATAARQALLDKLDAGFSAAGLTDAVTGLALTLNGGTYIASNDIQLPTTRDFGVDGKYFPVTLSSSDPETIVAPGVANAGRVTIYRPPVGSPAKTATLTVTMTDAAQGLSASRDFTVFVPALAQAEIDAELALMAQVKLAYRNGMQGGNDPLNVTSHLSSFQEVYSSDGTLVWVRDSQSRTNTGIVPVAMDGWYDLQTWRLFRSSNAAVISHENLLLAPSALSKDVTVSSALSSQTFGKYGARYAADPIAYSGYAPLAELYYQEVSADFVVRGRLETQMMAFAVVENPTVTFSLTGLDGQVWIGATSAYMTEGSTAFDVFRQTLADHGIDFVARAGYISAIATPDGQMLSEFDNENRSGWLYRVNGTLHDLFLNQYVLNDGDNIEVFYTRDYTVDSGYPAPTNPDSNGGGAPAIENPATEPPAPESLYTVAALNVGSYQATLHSGGTVLVTLPAGAAGQVIVLVRADGRETVVKKAIVTDGAARLLLSADATLKLVTPSIEFSDVNKGSWYRDAVAFAAGRQLFLGTPEGTFLPEAPMTRAMLVTVLHRLEEATAEKSASFPDVLSQQWHAPAVFWAAEQGLVTSNADGTFGPDQQITREQLAAILFRYASMVGLDTSGRSDLSSFSDSNDIADYAQIPIAWAVHVGLLQGDGTALFPAAPATRAEVATLLQRLIVLMVQP